MTLNVNCLKDAIILANLKQKVDSDEFFALKHKVNDLEASCNALQEQFRNQDKKITNLDQNFSNQLQVTEKENLRSEAYSKRFNLLIHRIEENPHCAWEVREDTKRLFDKFLIEGLNVSNPKDLPLVDIHRLPQLPIFKDEEKVN